MFDGLIKIVFILDSNVMLKDFNKLIKRFKIYYYVSLQTIHYSINFLAEQSCDKSYGELKTQSTAIYKSGCYGGDAMCG